MKKLVINKWKNLRASLCWHHKYLLVGNQLGVCWATRQRIFTHTHLLFFLIQLNYSWLHLRFQISIIAGLFINEFINLSKRYGCRLFCILNMILMDFLINGFHKLNFKANLLLIIWIWMKLENKKILSYLFRLSGTIKISRSFLMII